MSRRSFFQMQPTFELHFHRSLQESLATLKTNLPQDPYASLAGQVIDLRVAPEQRKYWSPHLTVQFEEVDESETTAYGRFSPRPEVWTMFAGIYAIVIFFIFMGSIYAYVQWLLGSAPWALLIIPIGLVVMLVLHAIGFKGQQWSEHQMDDLKSRFDQLAQVDLD